MTGYERQKGRRFFVRGVDLEVSSDGVVWARLPIQAEGRLAVAEWELFAPEPLLVDVVVHEEAEAI